MALHKDFPHAPHVILDPEVRWFPADEALRETSADKLMPPLVDQLRRKVKDFRDSSYVGATDTSKTLLNWWFKEPHLLPQSDGTMASFQYYFAQREALETIIYLYDVVGAKDKFDLMRFDSSGAVSAQMFDETWRRLLPGFPGENDRWKCGRGGDQRERRPRRSPENPATASVV